MDGLARHLPSPRQVLWGLLGAFVLLVVLVGIGYATTSIPNASSFATQQATQLLYKDGSHLARLGQTNRIDVPLSKVPLAVQHAVLAAEDRNFESEPGISPTGILRALFTDLRGGDISQGGSTITQQYVKNAYLSQSRTFTRKFKEIFIAVKLGNTRPKSEILQDYLNTIYYGRGAYGIQAAAKAYFGKDVGQLGPAQGAVLAALIQAPSFYDPDTHHAAALARWHYVVNGMVSQHWLTQAQADKLTYPKVMRFDPGKSSSGCTGPTYFICTAVQAELAKHGFDEQRLASGGYRVYTTIDKKAQAAAVAAEKANNGGYQTKGADRGRESALVTVQPGDGAIRAMYGGSDACGTAKRPDICTDLTGVASSYGRPAGSSFKPYTLIAALKQGISLDSTYPGPPHIPFPGTNGQGINNSEGESCGSCTLTQALAESINTVFVPLAAQVGPQKVVDAAHDAGIPKSVALSPVPVVTLGVDDVSPLDQAVAYATIAAQGVEADPYLVASVRTRDGRAVYKAQQHTHRAFDRDVMADTTYAMTKVLDCSSHGTGCGRALSGRPAAGKTGTNGKGNDNLDAWFIGFTPQLSTAVWYGNTDRHKPVTSNGVSIYGADLPAATWQQMMNAALAGEPVQDFPPPAHVGSDQGTTTASPTASSTSSSASPSASPSSTSPSSSPSPAVTTPAAPPRTLPPVSQSPSPSSSPSASPSPAPSQTAAPQATSTG